MPPPATMDASQPSPGYKWAALSVVMVGLFMAVLDGNIVNVALPHMMASYATNTDRIRWVVESYAVSYAVFTLTTSWIRERVGIRNTFLLGLVIFTIASALCGVAWSVESMIAMRILQGLGGGIMMPTGFTLITESFPPQERGTAFGVFGIVIVFAPSVGPTLGGYLVDSVNWRYVFYINVPIGVLTFFLGLAILKEFKKLIPRNFDFWGFLFLSLFLGCLLIALTEGQREGWNSDKIVSLFAIAAASFLIFLAIDIRIKNPIIDLTLFTNFHFAILSLLNIARSVALFGRVYLLPLFFQNLIGYSATTTGLLLSPGALVAGVVMPICGRLMDKYGPRPFLFIGFPVFALSNLLFYNLDVATPYHIILIPMLLYGLGAGMLNTPITATAMAVVRRDQIGEVSTILSVLMQLGGAFGVAWLGAVTNSRAAFHQAVYAENVAPHGHFTQSALQNIKTLAQKAGASPYLADLQAPAFLNSIVSKKALIAGYQDAFVYTGLLCLLAIIPALGLVSLKHHDQKAPGGPPARGGE